MIQYNFRAFSLVVSDLVLSVCEASESGGEELNEIASNFPCCPANSKTWVKRIIRNSLLPFNTETLICNPFNALGIMALKNNY